MRRREGHTSPILEGGRRTSAVVVACALVACGDGGFRDTGSATATARKNSGTGTAAENSGSATATAAENSGTGTGMGVPQGMVEIPEGVFLIGSPRGQGNPEERPAHERIVARFHLYATEVTWGAYRACVDEGVCKLPRPDDEFCNHRSKGRDDHPVNCVDWNDALAYCAWRGARLPTEAEWEYAAGGGVEGRKFSWGDVDPDRKRACFDHAGGTCPVASFAPGAFGLFDMSGNVWEWTSSYFSLFPGEATEGKRRVFKGGSWSRRWPKWLRVKNRSHWEPEKLNSWLGFRCARSAEPLVCPADTTREGSRCVRASGDPICEKSFGWNGRACTEIGADGKPVPGLGEVEHRPRPGDPGMPGLPDDPVSVFRAPGDDADCVASYPGKPVAWRWKGSTWEVRVEMIKAKGCTRRDNGPSWISACCKP